MFSKLFPVEEQPKNIQDEKGFRSRILAYTPETMMMEWHFFHANHVIPLHDHYHVQLSYIIQGSAKIILADGTERNCKAGDAVAFAPQEAHSVITSEPDTIIIDVFSPMRLDHLANHTS
ncbi:MAG: AraC family ligand binding domain-containing protein [Oscillospiraceae bacterium]|nr:AraC family ligand binding domain-containing protein [Oscillospiraceae bacterium]